ncbi:MAG: nucleotidyl transferase AbiEii/AbiGii toxin family protein [Dyadobacter sp.]|uniref:nucleotidyl transferase AbiEii/AbiGii toxin family protein n=1 Tax=Dyadobacter sp. TaxID=1914288 RepID=UPI001B195892|nr:nucleotidyl transferase AbiEii/AbiGii toxin family protein [Dyadobacter sp.]MBO9614694.1 nucleotidyl transferase AbiEii/AbiGii toxin family protein [Dyadobacter sp.]
MNERLKASLTRRVEILDFVSQATKLPPQTVEKDWWVTLALFAIFRTPFAQHLVFKGGTSLSKSWGLIERFSEDIDLVLDRSALGFEGELSRTQIAKLRRASCAFISCAFRDAIHNQISEIGVTSDAFSLDAAFSEDSDRDPQILHLRYRSDLEIGVYLRNEVLIEIGARSLREPAMPTPITSIISQVLGEKTIAGRTFDVLSVMPERTFLEKLFLLHEEFCKPADKIRHDRMSRHLYDLERIMDTDFGLNALSDHALYRTIVEHRRKFNAVKGVDYDSHSRRSICFIPGENVITSWEKDYRSMQENMIYGQSLPFLKLIQRLKELEERIRIIN